MKYSRLFILMFVVIALLFLSIKSDNVSKTESRNLQTTENQTKILLYFTSKEGNELVQEYRNVNFKDIRENMYETILKELIKGPSNNELNAIIPKDTKINSIVQEENKLIVDFSNEFNLNSGDENIELSKIYSIVDTLTEIKEINEVEIRVEGNLIACENRI